MKKVWIHDNDLFWYKVTLTFMIIWYVPYKSFKLILCNIRENLLTLIGRQTLIKIYVIWIYILNKISKLIKRGKWGFFSLKILLLINKKEHSMTHKGSTEVRGQQARQGFKIQCQLNMLHYLCAINTSQKWCLLQYYVVLVFSESINKSNLYIKMIPQILTIYLCTVLCLTNSSSYSTPPCSHYKSSPQKVH